MMQVVELGDALRAMGRSLQRWVDDGMPQADPDMVGVLFDIPARDVIELTEEQEDGTARFDPTWHGDVRRFVSEWEPVDGD